MRLGAGDACARPVGVGFGAQDRLTPCGWQLQCRAQLSPFQPLALAMLWAHSSQHRRLFPPADQAGFPRAAATALFPCCFHALLMLFSWPCACSHHSGGMAGACENPHSSCCPCLVDLVCTRDNQSKVNSIAGDSHLNT